jgi:hypothetical protein
MNDFFNNKGDLNKMKIKAWNFNIVWEDGTEEKNVDLPSHIMSDIEDFLNYLEEEDDLLCNH